MVVNDDNGKDDVSSESGESKSLAVYEGRLELEEWMYLDTVLNNAYPKVSPATKRFIKRLSFKLREIMTHPTATEQGGTYKKKKIDPPDTEKNRSN